MLSLLYIATPPTVLNGLEFVSVLIKYDTAELTNAGQVGVVVFILPKSPAQRANIGTYREDIFYTTAPPLPPKKLHLCVFFNCL